MIYRKRRARSTAPGSFYRFQGPGHRSVHGFGDGEFIRLRDEFGNVWRGTAEIQGDNTVRYRFRDSEGNYISGISDHFGILLRDDRGNVWRGFLE